MVRKIDRFRAILFDYLLISIIYLLCDYSAPILTYKDCIILDYFYFLILSKYFGNTLGQVLLGYHIESIPNNKQRIDWWFRSIMKMPFLSLINGISFLFTKNMWYDKSCKTIAVYNVKKNENTP